MSVVNVDTVKRKRDPADELSAVRVGDGAERHMA